MSSTSTASERDDLNSTRTKWRQYIQSLYPGVLRRTYCVPPVHLNRVPYRKFTLPNSDLAALEIQNLFSPKNDSPKEIQTDENKSDDNGKQDCENQSPETVTHCRLSGLQHLNNQKSTKTNQIHVCQTIELDSSEIKREKFQEEENNFIGINLESVNHELSDSSQKQLVSQKEQFYYQKQQFDSPKEHVDSPKEYIDSPKDQMEQFDSRQEQFHSPKENVDYQGDELGSKNKPTCVENEPHGCQKDRFDSQKELSRNQDVCKEGQDHQEHFQVMVDSKCVRCNNSRKTDKQNQQQEHDRQRNSQSSIQDYCEGLQSCHEHLQKNQKLLQGLSYHHRADGRSIQIPYGQTSCSQTAGYQQRRLLLPCSYPGGALNPRPSYSSHPGNVTMSYPHDDQIPCQLTNSFPLTCGPRPAFLQNGYLNVSTFPTPAMLHPCNTVGNQAQQTMGCVRNSASSTCFAEEHFQFFHPQFINQKQSDRNPNYTQINNRLVYNGLLPSQVQQFGFPSCNPKRELLEYQQNPKYSNRLFSNEQRKNLSESIKHTEYQHHSKSSSEYLPESKSSSELLQESNPILKSQQVRKSCSDFLQVSISGTESAKESETSIKQYRASSKPSEHHQTLPHRVSPKITESQAGIVSEIKKPCRRKHKRKAKSPPPSLPQSLWPQEPLALSSLKPPMESDVQNDCAQHHILVNLQELGDLKAEPMFVLSQLNFEHHLNKSAYAAAVTAAGLPRLADLPANYWRGDFDMAVIHRKFGVLIGELKSVGKTSESQSSSAVKKKVNQALKQLDKSATVMSHLLSDLSPQLRIRKTLFLPYISRENLLRVAHEDPALAQALCQTLEASNVCQAVRLCCCSNQLVAPAALLQHPLSSAPQVRQRRRVLQKQLRKLRRWWKLAFFHGAETTMMSDDLYLDILARLVGPATTVSVPCSVAPRVEVRTEGQAVAELGRRLARLVLTPQQVHLLHLNPTKVCITGPPGTGKTLMLVLQGLRWLRQGHRVHVLSIRPTSLAASLLVQHQLRLSVSRDHTPITPDRVCLHQFDFLTCEEDVQRAVQDLTQAVHSDGELHVLIDEAAFNTNYPHGPRQRRLVEQLTDGRVPRLFLWTAGMGNTDLPPQIPLEVSLTVPLRSAPAVVRQVQSGFDEFTDLRCYTDSGVPAPGDGMKVIYLRHHGNQHLSHQPVDCHGCGRAIAEELARLGVGGGDAKHLNWSDVFVVTRSSRLHDDVMNDAGVVTSEASDVVRGLRSAGVPVCVLGLQDRENDVTRWERDVAATVVGRHNCVTVADYAYVKGLERRLVVWLPGRMEEKDGDKPQERINAVDRLHAVSRCTTQLITVLMQ